MPSAVRLREDYSAEALRALAPRSKDANQSRRLLSLAAVLDGMDRGSAAKIGGMDRQTLRDWVHRFNGSGLEGLVDKAHVGGLPETTPVEIWFEDEARIGQKNGQVRQSARRGTRPRQPADQRYDNAYLFGAICSARGVGAALVLPYADADMMPLHLDEISRNVAEGAHAVLPRDRAGWHTTGKLDVPDNITPIFLPSRAPELNPVENVWQYLRQNWLSNTV